MTSRITGHAYLWYQANFFGIICVSDDTAENDVAENDVMNTSLVVQGVFSSVLDDKRLV